MIVDEIRSAAHARAVNRHGNWIVAVHDVLWPVRTGWEMLEREGHLTVFQRLDWLEPWYAQATMAKLAEPRIVTVRRVDETVPVLLLPLCIAKQAGRSVVEFAGQGLSDYRAPILAGVDRLSDAEAIEVLRFALAAIDGDLIQFSGIVPRVGGRSNPLASIANVQSAMGAHAVRLDPPAAPSRSSASFAKDLERLKRKLGREKAEPRFVVARQGDEARKLFDAMMHLRSLRFNALGREDALDVPAWQRFYDTVFTGHPEARFGIMVGIEVDGDIVAADACVQHGSAMHVLAGSFRQDDEWRTYGLGNLLTRMEIDWATSEGMEILDLTLGDEAYKSRFGAERQSLMEYHEARSLLAIPSWVNWRARSVIRQSPILLNAARTAQTWTGRLTAAMIAALTPLAYLAAEAFAQ